ncbi:MAG: glycosyltransferase [Polyangiaceae bacterium]|nr:glycosyltransferase [Polyangiaceae bacterium]
MTTVLMAGGGTGGHVFPMVAVAHALQRLDPSIRPVFVGTERGMETRFVPKQGFELELLKVLPIRGGGASGAIRGAVRAAATLPESRELIRRIRPKAIFSIGGYAA